MPGPPHYLRVLAVFARTPRLNLPLLVTRGNSPWRAGQVERYKLPEPA